MAKYPSAESIVNDSEGQNTLEIHRSLKSILSNLIWFVISTILITVLVVLSYKFNFENIPFVGSFNPFWLSIIPLGMLIEVIRKYHDDLYSFSKESLTHRDGRLSLTYTVPVIRYADIRLVVIDQDFCGRLLDYGNIELSSSGSDGNETIISGVSSPHQLVELIEHLRSLSLSRLERSTSGSDDSRD